MAPSAQGYAAQSPSPLEAAVWYAAVLLCCCAAVSLCQTGPQYCAPVMSGREADLVVRQAPPDDVLFLAGDDVHGHQHVQGIIHAPPDVLLIILARTARCGRHVLSTSVHPLCRSAAALSLGAA